MPDKSVTLKSVMFGGFEKKAVLSYIFDLNESAQEAQHKLSEKIDELNASREALSENVREMEQRIASMQSGLDEGRARLDGETRKHAESQSLVGRLNAEIEKQQRILDEKSEEIARYTAMNSELAEKNRQLEVESREALEKAKELDEKRGELELAASQIGKLFTQAQQDADRIVELANGEADVIRRKAGERADGIIDEAKLSAEAYVKNASRSLDGIYAQFGEFCDELGALQKSIREAAATMTGKMDALNEAVAKTRAIAPARDWNSGEAASPVVVEFKRETPKVASDTETSALANEILGHYGIHKDESGFFRLAADK